MKTWTFSQRLSEIKRFTGLPTASTDSVAGHSFRVALIASRLWEEFPHPGVDGALVMTMALVHDFEESMFGDIPTNFKKYLKPQYDKAARDAINDEGLLSKFQREAFNMKKSNVIEAEIVEFADKLDAILFLERENERGNNDCDKWKSELYGFFYDHCGKIEAYYPYIERVLGELNGTWKRNLSKQKLPHEDMEGGASLWFGGC